MTIINNTKRGEKEQNVRMEKVNCVTIPLVLYSFKETEEDFLHMFLFLDCNKDTLNPLDDRAKHRESESVK